MGEYLAPGVYVEEVPSAVQPIAGVGTNTAAFIGIVPDELQCPIPNPEYDPQLAAAAAEPAVDAQQIATVQEEIRSRTEERNQAQQRLTEITQELAQPELADDRRRALTREQTQRGQRVDQLTRDINNGNQRLEELRAP